MAAVSDEWILVGGAEELHKESASETESILAKYESENSANEEDNDEASSVFSTLMDDLSSSWYETLWEDVEISPGIPCYFHSRNKKLNKSLNLVVTLVFSVVAGLAIGNFIGLTKNCMYERDLYRESVQSALSDISNNRQPAWMPLPSSSVELREDVSKVVNKKMSHSSASLDQPELITVLLVDGDSLSKLPVSRRTIDNLRACKTKSNDMHTDNSMLTNITKQDQAKKADVRSVTVDTMSLHTAVDSSLFTVEGQQNLFRNVQAKNTNSHTIVDNKIRFKQETLTDSKKFNVYSDRSGNSEFTVLLQHLRDTINDIVLKSEELAFMMLPKDEGSATSNMDMTKDALNQYTDAVKSMLSELFALVPSQTSKYMNKETKHLLKLTRVLVKSTDNLLKVIFKEMLLKSHKPVEDRMKNVRDVAIFLKGKLTNMWREYKNKTAETRMGHEGKKKYGENRDQNKWNRDKTRGGTKAADKKYGKHDKNHGKNYHNNMKIQKVKM